MDDLFEKLYELLTLYFDYGRVKTGVVSCNEIITSIEPQLDSIILKEDLAARIDSILRNYYTSYNE